MALTECQQEYKGYFILKHIMLKSERIFFVMFGPLIKKLLVGQKLFQKLLSTNTMFQCCEKQYETDFVN